MAKVAICLLLLATVSLVCCKSYKFRSQDSDQNDSRPGIRVQDVSSEESKENVRKIGLKISQEDSDESIDIRQAPRPTVFSYTRSYGQEIRHNKQKSRSGNGEVDSDENMSRNEWNKVNRQTF